MSCVYINSEADPKRECILMHPIPSLFTRMPSWAVPFQRSVNLCKLIHIAFLTQVDQ